MTGGSGFIGRYFHEALTGAGDSVSIFDLVEPRWDAAPSRVTVGDVRDPAAVRRALAGCDAVLHLAAAHHDFGIARETFFTVNEEGARVLASAMSEAGVKNLCFFSTVAVYGATREPRQESAATSPVSAYGESKLAAERAFQSWAEAGQGRRCLVIRPTVVFGPRNYANMYTLIHQVDSGLFLRVGSGHNLKSLAYVENVVDAALYLWNRPAESPFEVFNYADKPDLETRSILSAIYRALNRREPSIHVPLGLALAGAFPFDAVIRTTGRNLPISSARIRKMCAQTKFEADKVLGAGFTPRVSLVEGIGRMVHWYQIEGRNGRAETHLPPRALRTGSLVRAGPSGLGGDA